MELSNYKSWASVFFIIYLLLLSIGAILSFIYNDIKYFNEAVKLGLFPQGALIGYTLGRDSFLDRLGKK